MIELAYLPQKLGIEASFEPRSGAQWLNVAGFRSALWRRP